MVVFFLIFLNPNLCESLFPPPEEPAVVLFVVNPFTASLEDFSELFLKIKCDFLLIYKRNRYVLQSACMSLYKYQP